MKLPDQCYQIPDLLLVQLLGERLAAQVIPDLLRAVEAVIIHSQVFLRQDQPQGSAAHGGWTLLRQRAGFMLGVDVQPEG